MGDLLADEPQPKVRKPGTSFNPQLYKNSGAGSVDEVLYDANPDRLTDDIRPNLTLKKEQPQHRMIVMLKAQGRSNRSIAETMGMDEAWISQVLRQPWARQRLVQEITEMGRDAVREMLSVSAIDSLNRLIDLRDDPKTPAGVKRQACSDLLDRALGKAVQRSENVNFQGGGPVELAKLEQERRVVAAELAKYLGGNLEES